MSDTLEPPPPSIGARIREARKAAGLNQAALAARVGVTQPAVANWESGVHDPRRLVMARIADALGVSPGWLAGGARSPREADRHPAAGYLRRAIRHAPTIPLVAAARLLDDPEADPHAFAEDYIPVTTRAERVFAFFQEDPAMAASFPLNSLVVIDYDDRAPSDGMVALIADRTGEGIPRLRRWRAAPRRLVDDRGGETPAPPAPCVIGCARVSIRFY